MGQKLEVLRGYYIDGKGIKQLVREMHLSRNTIRSYIRSFAKNKAELLSADTLTSTEELVEQMVEKPKYDSSKRQSRVITDDVVKIIDEFLCKNEEKRAAGMKKQCMKAIDIYEELIKKEFKLSYPSVNNYIRQKEVTKKEAFIKQMYHYGDICEFDWGDIKLYILGKQVVLKIAVFTLAKSNFRFAIIYKTEDTQAFLDAHVKFFEHIGGVPKTHVYDNMKVAVAKFVGPNEKEATDALKKLSLYYGFSFRFCNVRRGNEKGHVENAVEFVRRKAFACRYKFENLKDAEVHLKETLKNINQTRLNNENCKPNESLKKEREYFLPLMPTYDTACVKELRVDKLSTVAFKCNRYSVPDHLVGKYITAKIYVDKIKIYYNNNKIDEHKRSYDRQSWTLKIEHYRNTLIKKPGALKNSLALSQTNFELKKIHDEYFESKPREFLELINLVAEHGIDKINSVIKTLRAKSICINFDNISVIINRNVSWCGSSINSNDSNNLIEQEAKKHLNRYDQLANTYNVESEVFV